MFGYPDETLSLMFDMLLAMHSLGSVKAYIFLFLFTPAIHSVRLCPYQLLTERNNDISKCQCTWARESKGALQHCISNSLFFFDTKFACFKPNERQISMLLAFSDFSVINKAFFLSPEAERLISFIFGLALVNGISIYPLEYIVHLL